jgi:serine/threonine protein kinase
MEYMIGGDLGGLLFEFGVFEKDMVQFYCGEMTLAIEYLHENGIVHRDIKPDSIIPGSFCLT